MTTVKRHCELANTYLGSGINKFDLAEVVYEQESM